MILQPCTSPQSPSASIPKTSGCGVSVPAGTFVRIVPFSMRKIPSFSVPARIVFPALASVVTGSPVEMGVSQSELATSNLSTVSESYPAI